MKKNLWISIWYTLATTLLLGLVYPLVVTGLAQMIFPKQANGDLIERNGVLVGSRLLGQPFTAPGYFYSRPSAAGVAGYDPTASGGSNLGPTNKALIDRVEASVKQLQPTNPGTPIPVDLVTTSGSGLDPDISPAAAEFQIPRVAKERGMSEQEVRSLVAKHTEERQLGFLGERRVNVLELNLALDSVHPMNAGSASLR
jgi:potassium-transporting ATPase KdpC subunit